MVPIPRIWSGNIARFASCLHGCMLQCRRQRQRVRHVAMVQPNRAMRGLFASKDRWLLAIGQSNPELQVKRLWTSTICRLDRSFGSKLRCRYGVLLVAVCCAVPLPSPNRVLSRRLL